MESLTALSIISVLILLYLPFMNGLVQKMNEEKMEVEMSRLIYDSARKENESEKTWTEWKTGKWSFEVRVDLESTQKGIHVKDAKGTKEDSVQIIAVQWE